jgi:hypothetical protein
MRYFTNNDEILQYENVNRLIKTCLIRCKTLDKLKVEYNAKIKNNRLFINRINQIKDATQYIVGIGSLFTIFPYI